MKILSVALAMQLVGCVQQPAGQLEARGQKDVEILPPDALEQLPTLVDEVLLNETVVLRLPPPLSASSVVSTVPPASTRIGQVRQITIAFDLIGAGAPNVAALEFVGPGGAPYERQEIAIEGSAFDPHHLEFVMPVAATAIELGRMSGMWSARLSIDGQGVKTHPFELTP